MKESPRILVVDDTPENLDFLGNRLRALGYRTTVVTDGARAVESVREDPPDAIIMDVMMPEMNGFQACRAIKRERPELPILILTGKSDPADRFWAMECGADAFITKPADPAAVVERLVALLANR